MASVGTQKVGTGYFAQTEAGRAERRDQGGDRQKTAKKTAETPADTGGGGGHEKIKIQNGQDVGLTVRIEANLPLAVTPTRTTPASRAPRST
jgi:hypothetical protein